MGALRRLPMSYFPTFAYCSPAQRWAVRHAAGVDPLTCPPSTLATFDPGLLRNRKLLYFSLHGIPQQPYWYGADTVTAISTRAFHGLDLSDTIVFVANCHLPETPFLEAILECKPLFLAGGRGVNFTRGHALVGAHLLGYLFRLAVELSIPPAYALAMAKYTLTARTDVLQKEANHLKNRSAKRRLSEDIAANLDALEFTAFT